MSFVQPRRSMARQSAGIGAAVVFHVSLVWALMNGLARQVMQVINPPVEVQMIKEVQPPPPPKVMETKPSAKVDPPAPAFVPPPEVQTETASPQPNALQYTSTEAPAESLPTTPARIDATRPAPAAVSASVACSNYSTAMGEAAFPRAAARLGLEEGNALIEFTLGAGGEIKNIKAVRASHRVFAESSIRVVSSFQCAGRGSDVLVQVPFVYQSE